MSNPDPGKDSLFNIMYRLGWEQLVNLKEKLFGKLSASEQKLLDDMIAQAKEEEDKRR